MARALIVLGILLPDRWLRAILWLFFFGSREENALALGRQLKSQVSMALMNHKCQPVALYLEQIINALVWQILLLSLAKCRCYLLFADDQIQIVLIFGKLRGQISLINIKPSTFEKITLFSMVRCSICRIHTF